jgi:phage terminase large subunit GpA
MPRRRVPGGPLNCGIYQVPPRTSDPAGATSAKGLRSIPARYLFLDEVDGFPSDANLEGDRARVAIQRNVTFRGRRKIYIVSTPTIEGESRIAKAYAESDQRMYEVPSGECGAFSHKIASISMSGRASLWRRPSYFRAGCRWNSAPWRRPQGWTPSRVYRRPKKLRIAATTTITPINQNM